MLFIQQRLKVVRGAKGRDALVCGCPGARDGDGVAAARHDSIIMGDVGRSAARVRGSCQASAAFAFRRGARGLLAALEAHVGGALNDRFRGVHDGDGLIARNSIVAPAGRSGDGDGATARFSDRRKVRDRRTPDGRGGADDADADEKYTSEANPMMRASEMRATSEAHTRVH